MTQHHLRAPPHQGRSEPVVGIMFLQPKQKSGASAGSLLSKEPVSAFKIPQISFPLLLTLKYKRVSGFGKLHIHFCSQQRLHS